MNDIKKTIEERYELDNVHLHIDGGDDNISLGFKDEDGHYEWNFLPKSKMKTIIKLLSIAINEDLEEQQAIQDNLDEARATGN